ncbi:ATP-binding protein [Rhodococcus sp. Z13]|uniref:ATP-binding protein n=1 Tax=Rhodococcus sacchari TaxID=2962047 RepID=A0ACD4DK32_9NOCA|nr:ATP-binding protein [Rhodococcus sp. Z13]UYP20381.1 ATP-binding protein [Rhodococcus sp. Z13]
MSSAPDESTAYTTHGVRSVGVPADPTEIAGLRVVLRRWLADLPMDEDRRQDILLASYEALANAVEHAYSPGDSNATLDLTADFLPHEGELVVRVADHGSWHDAVSSDARRSRGHGLTLIRSLADGVDVSPGPTGTIVEMRWSLPSGDDLRGDGLPAHDAS